MTDEELMELMILPLTVKGKKEKQPVIISAVELAKRYGGEESPSFINGVLGKIVNSR